MLIGLFTFAALMTMGFVIGTQRERRHLETLRKREASLAHIPATTGLILPNHSTLHQAQLVHGTVVISVDYFKRLVAMFRMLLGGRITSYESILERARREAVLRMKEDAIHQDADGIINVRIETSRIATGHGENGVAGIEVLAYGTSIRT
jgi:uncharacterized protein YbjQ (UPF0145 family)